jgi:ubiquinone/menaquinone biosynthesis C-methylase UbiE
METNEAVELIRAAVTEPGGTWADLGAGNGTFTRALAALLGPNGTVYAVDRDANALRDLARSNSRNQSASIHTIVSDFTEPLELIELNGIVLANALHYVPHPDQPDALTRITSMLAADAPLVIIEYDRRGANRWVPYPVSIAALNRLARDAGLTEPTILAKRPSQYGGDIYSAVVR